MTDRELLELAAKAAGIALLRSRLDDPMCCDFLLVERTLDGNGLRWNPLTEDGDAMRLAANLRLQILPGKHKGDGCTVETQRAGIAGCTAFYDDKAQQMRQAIVRAAAEIGKAMP